MIDNKIINKTHLLVLKRNSDYKTVKIDYFEIINPIKPLLEKLDFLIDNFSLEIIGNFILNTPELTNFFGQINYCENLSKPFQGIQSIDLEDFFSNSNTLLPEEIQWKKLELKREIKKRIIPYSLEFTYKISEYNNEILAFSHRKVGWTMPTYYITPDFTIQFYTNFGYGNSSYFFTKLTYKGIDILPFSEWIRYRYANFYDIIRYSIKHELKNESWLDAMNYVKEAIDLYSKNQKEFIKTYILNECKKMVEGLKNIINNHIFSFKQFDGSYSDYEFTDKRLLIDFRGEKISGALNFISKIIMYRNIIEVDEFINTIIKLNKAIYPILLDELSHIKKELKENEDEYKIIKVKFEEVSKEYDFYLRFEKKLKKLISSKVNTEEKIDIKKCLSERFPDYLSTKNKYELLNKEFYEKILLIHKLKEFESNFYNYINIINLFLKEQPS